MDKATIPLDLLFNNTHVQSLESQHHENMGGSRVGIGGRDHISPMENHRWLLVSLEILVRTALKGVSFGPL